MVIEEVRPNLFVQKTIFGDYKVIKPIKKDITKPLSWDNIHWKRLTIGSWNNLITLGMIFGVMALLVIAYISDTGECRELIETLDKDPCTYCKGVIGSQGQRFILPDLDSIKGEEVDGEKG